MCHEVLSQSESENEMRQAFARSIIEHIEREDRDNETNSSPAKLSEAYSTDTSPNLDPEHQLTWCQGELWEGGCPHSNMEPEPVTDESGQVKGWVSFNHDGTTSTTPLPICKHTKCTRYCDKDNESTTCPPCAQIEELTECTECKSPDQRVGSTTPKGKDTIKESRSTTPTKDRALHSSIISRNKRFPTRANDPPIPKDGSNEQEGAPWEDLNFSELFTHGEDPWGSDCSSMSMDDDQLDIYGDDFWNEDPGPKQVSNLKTTNDNITAPPTRGIERWHAPCATEKCPCTASYNGQDGEACCKECKIHKPCKSNKHYFPKRMPKAKDTRQPHSLMEKNPPQIYSKECTRRVKMDIDLRQRPTPTSYHSSFSGPRGHPRTYQ